MPTHEIAIRVLGSPRPQPRPRSSIRKIFDRSTGQPKLVVRAYDDGSAEGWKTAVARAAQDHRPSEPLEGAVRVEIDFLIRRPKGLMRRKDPKGRMRHAGHVDRDNLEKSTLDILQSLGFFRDDGQVCCGEVRKFWTAIGELPGAEIRIEPAEELGETAVDLTLGLFAKQGDRAVRLEARASATDEGEAPGAAGRMTDGRRSSPSVAEVR